MGSSVRDGVGHRAYRRKRDALKRRAKSLGLVCVHCGVPFDWTITDPNASGAFTADHPDALANGGHLVRQDLGPMHKGCNSRKGDRADTEIWGAS